MSNKFLERNKKKSVLALLLLLLKWKRGAVPLLVAVVLLMLVFVSPNNFLGINLEQTGIGRLLSKLFGRDPQAYGSLASEIEAARERDARTGGATVYQRGGAAGAAGMRGGAGGDSLDMVRGKASEIGEGTVSVDGGKSVKGIEKPEGLNDKGAVALDDGDMRGERAGGGGADHQEAGVFGGAFKNGRGLSSLFGPYASKGFFAGQSPAAGRSSATDLNGNTKVPNASLKVVPGDGGRLSRRWLSQAALTPRAAGSQVVRRRGLGAWTSMRQLTDGRGRAQLARDPLCTSTSGCPPEFAATNTGAVYDGNRVGSGAGTNIVTTNNSAVDGMEGGTKTPNGNQVTDQEDALSLIDKAKKCDAAQQKWRPQQEAYAKEIQRISDSMRSTGCCGGAQAWPNGATKAGLVLALLNVSDRDAFAGCSKGQARQCSNYGDQMVNACKNYDNSLKGQYDECPLMQEDGPYVHYDCTKSCN